MFAFRSGKFGQRFIEVFRLQRPKPLLKWV
jgi:hypothetical protein